MRKSDTVIVRPVRQARHLVASLLAGVLLAGCATGDGEAPPAASVAATVDPGHPDTGHPDFGGMLHSDHVLTAARVLNPQLRIETVGDDADLREVYETERHLLYVACTRARDFLLITSGGPASEFLDDLLQK